MVPNSLGPAELLLRYGTDAQKAHYLPRLADGRDLPCFALTSPYAGSDAASIPDRGAAVEREIDGVRVRGFLVTFSQALHHPGTGRHGRRPGVPRLRPADPKASRSSASPARSSRCRTPGVQIGRRHRPLDSAFMNGPITGQDVFVPLDWVIGGAANVGQGWRMLMESLAAGRAISLPALGSAMQQTSLFVANGYGLMREQFGLQIGRFHAVAALIARMAVDLYATDAARRYTAAVLDTGESPSVASAILKVQLTEAGRRAVNDTMDILGGKAIMRGPSNLMAVAYRHAPIAITVEGANILTRALIIFGQGAIRCHPYLLSEMQAAQARDAERLGRALLGHVEARAAQPVAQSGACPAPRVAAARTHEGGAPDRAAQRQVRADRRPGDGPARRQAQAHGVAVRAARRRTVQPVSRLGLRVALQDRRRRSPTAVRARRDPRATRRRRRGAARPVRQPAVAGAARARRTGTRRDRPPRAVARPAVAGVRRRLAE